MPPRSKRKAGESVATENGNESDGVVGTRSRRPSSKHAAVVMLTGVTFLAAARKQTESDKRLALLEKKIKALTKKNKELEAAQINAGSGHEDQADGDDQQSAESPGPESEEEDGTLVQARQLKSAFESRGIYETRPAPKRLRRAGDPPVAPEPTATPTTHADPLEHQEHSSHQHRTGRQEAQNVPGPAAQPSQPPLSLPFKDGKVPEGKPKAGDYEPGASKLVLRACREYEVLIATEDPFPDPAKQNAWATRVWTSVCTGAQVSYKLTDRLERIITDRGSHARGEVRDKIRPHIEKNYGFIDDGSERAKLHNIATYHRLLDSEAPNPDPKFVYKYIIHQNPETRSKYAHNAIILKAIKETWFADPSLAPAIKYTSQFSPIRDVTLALLFTAWAEGSLNKNLMFTQKAYETKYNSHLQHVRDWINLAPEFAETVRQRMYDRARRIQNGDTLDTATLHANYDLLRRHDIALPAGYGRLCIHQTALRLSYIWGVVYGTTTAMSSV
ncbi:hypothetical protein C8Q78DRAFT_1141488 [Trametes maxima]|nr:hypothetical protein C8Q78DRAFT_1141488 [Trametes maxima]